MREESGHSGYTDLSPGQGPDKVGAPKSTGRSDVAEAVPLLEAMARYVAELELLSEGIDRVRELIRRSTESEGWRKERQNLRDASARLAERIRGWARELDRDFSIIRDRFAGRVEPDEGRRLAPGESGAGAAKVALVDRSALFRRGMRKILEGRPGLAVVKEASDLNRADEIAGSGADILVAHLGLNGSNDLARIAEMKKDRPELMVVLVVPRGDPGFLSRLVRSGADACLIEDSDDQRFLYAIERVLKGKSYFSPVFSESLLEGLKREDGQKPGLTQREREVLRLVAEGRSSRDIAGRLFISVHTVERHRANIMGKLNMNKVADLVKYAIAQGLTDANGGGHGR